MTLDTRLNSNSKFSCDAIDGEGFYDVLLRSLMLDLLCGLDYEECVDRAVSDFAEWQETTVNPIDVEVRDTAYCTAIRNGDSADWEFLFEQYPELNQECERLKSGITFAIEDQVCFVEGGMIRDEACRTQAKNSYIITISVQDLEPIEVLWRRQDRYIPEYQGDLEEYSNLPRE